MKLITLTIIILLINTVRIYPQVFTKITSGQPVADGGDSRAVNWVDYDNDGDLDLYITNGPQAGQNNFFYVNNGDGTFTKDTLIAIANDGKASDGSSWGDYDNDGDVDLFIASWWNHNNLLYRNNGDQTFTSITNSQIYTDRGYSETGSWGDSDRDGFLDLYVCNSYSQALRNFFYKNNKDGSFTKVTNGAIVTDLKVSRNIDWIDYDEDGDDDIFIANEENQNEDLYNNDGSALFTKITTGALLTAGGSSSGSIWEDFDNDGDFDVFITNQNQNNSLFLNNGDGAFIRMTTGSFVTDGGNSFGSTTGDVDNDGDVDLFVANAFTGSNQTNNFLYLNNGDGTFERVTTDPSANDGGWSYGCALGDYDKDGYLDLAVGKCFNANENNSLFKNNGGSGGWLIIDLEGRISNRSAIGTVVKIKANINGKDVWQMRRVAGQNGYCGQTLQLHFGLGNAAHIDSVQINWPSGRIENLGSYAVNQFLKIIEDTTLTDIGSIESLPSEFLLNQNYPNPFNPSTTISFSIPQKSFITLKLFDSLGKEISILIENEKEAGVHEYHLNNSDLLTSGIYFYQLLAGEFSETKKLTYIK